MWPRLVGAWKFSAFSTSCWRLFGSWRTQQENPLKLPFGWRWRQIVSQLDMEVKMMKIYVQIKWYKDLQHVLSCVWVQNATNFVDDLYCFFSNIPRHQFHDSCLICLKSSKGLCFIIKGIPLTTEPARSLAIEARFPDPTFIFMNRNATQVGIPQLKSAVVLNFRWTWCWNTPKNTVRSGVSGNFWPNHRFGKNSVLIDRLCFIPWWSLISLTGEVEQFRAKRLRVLQSWLANGWGVEVIFFKVSQVVTKKVHGGNQQRHDFVSLEKKTSK